MAGGGGREDGGQQEMRVVCTQAKQASPDLAYIVTHFTMGCQSGFVCMAFYRRDGHVIEVQTGGHVRRAEDACHANHFNRTAQPFVTLVTSSPEPRQCPYLGKFSVTGVTRDDRHLFRAARSLTPVGARGAAVDLDLGGRKGRGGAADSFDPEVQNVPGGGRNAGTRLPGSGDDPKNPRIGEESGADGEEELLPGHERSGGRKKRDRRERDPEDPCGPDADDFTTLVVGCSTTDTMEFRSECMTDVVSAYSCHGRWEDNGTHFLITTPLSRSSHGARRYCFMYRETDGVVHFSSSAASCQRNISPGVGGALAFNVTSSGQCVEANGASMIRYGYALIAISLLIIVTTNFHLLQTLTIQR